MHERIEASEGKLVSVAREFKTAGFGPEDHFAELLRRERACGPYEVIINAAADHERWLDERDHAGRIGSSEIASVLGTGYDTPCELYASKLGLRPRLEDRLDDDGRERLEMGRLMERTIMHRYQDASGRLVTLHGTLLRSKQHPWLVATPDASVYDGELGLGCLELKWPGLYARHEWWDDAPLMYRIQLEAQLIVTGRRWGAIAAVVGGVHLHWHEYTSDDELRARILEEGAEFHRRLLEEDPPPPSDSDADALALLYGDDAKEGDDRFGMLLDDPELLAADEEHRKISRAIRILSRRRDELENTIAHAVGDAAYGVLPDGSRWSWRTIKRRAYSVAESTYRVFRRKKPRRRYRRRREEY